MTEQYSVEEDGPFGEGITEDLFADPYESVSLSPEEEAILAYQYKHIRAAKRITPERYALILRALKEMVTISLREDDEGFFCGYCGCNQEDPYLPTYSEEEDTHPPIPAHEAECVIPQVEALLKELEGGDQ
jgi:hypothetical protein